MNETDVKDVRKMLEEEISCCFDNMDESSYYNDKEKMQNNIDTLTKLYKLKIEEDKNYRDAELKAKEDDLKKKQNDEDNKHRLLKLGVDVGNILVSLTFFGIWMKRGFKFEETGTFTSKTFRDASGKFLNFLFRK